jgi:hypothetical protein
MAWEVAEGWGCLGGNAHWGANRGGHDKVALHGNMIPVGSSTNCRHPSAHVSAPALSKSTRAGIVITPNMDIRSGPLAPVESERVIAVQGMVAKYCSVLALVLK